MHVPSGTEVFTLWLGVLCMRSKAWLAAPVLLTHPEVTAYIICFQWIPNLGTPRYACMCVCLQSQQMSAHAVEVSLLRKSALEASAENTKLQTEVAEIERLALCVFAGHMLFIV
jgi:hypothetical protein